MRLHDEDGVRLRHCSTLHAYLDRCRYHKVGESVLDDQEPGYGPSELTSFAQISPATTNSPAATNRSTIARPCPLAAPVTIATLPSSCADFLLPLAIEGTANDDRLATTGRGQADQKGSRDSIGDPNKWASDVILCVSSAAYASSGYAIRHTELAVFQVRGKPAVVRMRLAGRKG